MSINNTKLQTLNVCQPTNKYLSNPLFQHLSILVHVLDRKTIEFLKKIIYKFHYLSVISKVGDTYLLESVYFGFQLSVTDMRFDKDFEISISYKDAFEPHIIVERGHPKQGIHVRKVLVLKITI